MTSVTETPGRSGGRTWGLWVALALSVTLNAFVAGGLFWSMMNPPGLHPLVPPNPSPAERLIDAARALDLSPDQQAALRNFAATTRDEQRALRESNGPLVREMWAEIAKPNPDTAAITHLTDQAIDARRSFQHTMLSGLMTFLATLSPEQRQAVIDAATHRRPPGPPKPQ